MGLQSPSKTTGVSGVQLPGTGSLRIAGVDLRDLRAVQEGGSVAAGQDLRALAETGRFQMLRLDLAQCIWDVCGRDPTRSLGLTRAAQAPAVLKHPHPHSCSHPSPRGHLCRENPTAPLWPQARSGLRGLGPVSASSGRIKTSSAQDLSRWVLLECPGRAWLWDIAQCPR